jgi:hypothetical protein
MSQDTERRWEQAVAAARANQEEARVRLVHLEAVRVAFPDVVLRQDPRRGYSGEDLFVSARAHDRADRIDPFHFSRFDSAPAPFVLFAEVPCPGAPPARVYSPHHVGLPEAIELHNREGLSMVEALKRTCLAADAEAARRAAEEAERKGADEAKGAIRKAQELK